MDEVNIRKILSENFSLFSILIGIVLVSISIGPFQNWDTQYEQEAVLGVIKWNMPYVTSLGNFVNQPPLGFYVKALFHQTFGLSIDVSAALVTIFGLGCILLIYKIGKVLYGKSTGLLASALFALSPWELILSRSLLIDVQCLFFSLLCLLVGIYAVQRSSLRLFLLSGAFFAAAFLTKLFAVFVMIPLFLFYFYHKPNNFRQMFRWFVVFFLPVLFSVFLWYQVISGQGLLSFFHHNDFVSYNTSVPSSTFIANFLVNYGLGWFFIDATILSLLVGFLFKRFFPKIFIFDLICLVTIVSVLGVNIFLAVGLNLKSPYFTAVKYDYQSLPFFSLLAASLAGKCYSLFSMAKTKKLLKKISFCSLAVVGLILLGGAIFVNIQYASHFSTSDYLLLRMEMDQNLGYSFFDSSPIAKYSLSMSLQYLGFIIVLSGLAWSSRHKLGFLNKKRS